MACAAALGLLLAPRVAAAQRTVYERLAFATPQEAAQAFLRAWRSQDFATVYWILAPETQNAIAETYERLLVEPLVGRVPPTANRLAVAEEAMPILAAREHHNDMAWLFDFMMQVGRRRGATPFVLPEGVEAGTPAMLPDGRAASKVGMLEMLLTRSPAGHWRVLGVFGPGADRSQLPWGIGP
ncbi:hypothetical protein [Falsiroseomonas sp. HW251]|uniref:hypothetical protein n=1 Tax=Falsiroseomonas sp. HW251 TaxID=3390998 RepID=UPI003D3158C9